MPVALRVLMLTLLVLFVLLRQIRRKMFMQVSCIVLTYSYNFHTFSYPPFPTSHTFVHFAYLVIKFRTSFIAFPIFSAFSCIFPHVHICFATFHIYFRTFCCIFLYLSYLFLCFSYLSIFVPLIWQYLFLRTRLTFFYLLSTFLEEGRKKALFNGGVWGGGAPQVRRGLREVSQESRKNR